MCDGHYIIPPPPALPVPPHATHHFPPAVFAPPAAPKNVPAPSPPMIVIGPFLLLPHKR